MIKNLIAIFIIILQLSFCHCNPQKGKILTTIDIESNIKNMDIVKLSSFTDNIQYIPLENVKNLPLQNLNQIEISDSFILVSDLFNCILFDNKGRFVTKIGINGRGPGEYQMISNLGLVSGINSKVYLSSLYDIYEFSINGSFIKKYSESLLIDNNLSLTKWFLINDSLFFGHIGNYMGKAGYKAVVVNKHGTIKHEFENYIFYGDAKAGIGGGEAYAHIYRFGESIFYKELFNDTLFCLNDNYELTPKYFFHLGRYKMPASERAKDPGLIWNYISVYDVFQTKNYLIINCRFGHHFPAKRITPKPPLVPGGEPIWINTNYMLGLFDKQTGDLVFCKPADTDNPLFTTGLHNDIDCGPRFFPKTMVNDSTMVMWVPANELKAHVASDDFKNNTPKFPEKKKQLKELADKLNDFDNTVLMFVTFK